VKENLHPGDLSALDCQLKVDGKETTKIVNISVRRFLKFPGGNMHEGTRQEQQMPFMFYGEPMGGD
jgi:hypothetical protein